MKRILFFSFLSLSLMHSYGSTPVPYKKNLPLEIIQTGTWRQQPLYECRNLTATSQPLWLVIKDEYGQLLYEERVSPGATSPRFLFNQEELQNAGIVFEVYSDFGVLLQRSKRYLINKL